MPFKWKVQTANAYKCTMVPYVDARQVMDMLDEVVGADSWQTKFEIINGHLFCSVGVKCGEEWVWKSDCGTESNVEKEKGEASDAFKRACIHWGVGRFLYSLKILEIPSMEYANKAGKKSFHPANNGKMLFDKDEINAYCMSIHRGKTPTTKPAAKPDRKPPKTQLDQVKIGIEGPTGWRVDIKKVEAEILKLHGKLPTTIDGREKCIKELSVPDMESKLHDDLAWEN